MNTRTTGQQKSCHKRSANNSTHAFVILTAIQHSQSFFYSHDATGTACHSRSKTATLFTFGIHVVFTGLSAIHNRYTSRIALGISEIQSFVA